MRTGYGLFRPPELRLVGFDFRSPPELLVIQNLGQFRQHAQAQSYWLQNSGAVGLFGVLLSGAHGRQPEWSREQAINSAQHPRQACLQTIADHTLQGNIALRGMELAVRDYQAVEEFVPNSRRAWAASNAAFTAVTRELDVAIGNVAKFRADKERLEKIRFLAAEYNNQASEIGKAQLRIFEITKKAERSPPPSGPRHLKTCCCSSAADPPRQIGPIIEKVLNEADSMFNSVRSAATWQLIANRRRGAQKNVIDKPYRWTG